MEQLIQESMEASKETIALCRGKHPFAYMHCVHRILVCVEQIDQMGGPMDPDKLAARKLELIQLFKDQEERMRAQEKQEKGLRRCRGRRL